MGSEYYTIYRFHPHTIVHETVLDNSRLIRRTPTYLFCWSEIFFQTKLHIIGVAVVAEDLLSFVDILKGYVCHANRQRL